jgi:hypothetical protein
MANAYNPYILAQKAPFGNGALEMPWKERNSGLAQGNR